MPDSLIINDKIASFNDVISVSGDKSLSIRWVLLSSLASGVSPVSYTHLTLPTSVPV